MKNTLETRLGLFFALALVVAVVVLEMVGAADFFKSGYNISTTFKSVQELKKGDLVKMAGVEIGRVDSIALQGNQARVTLKIEDRKPPYPIRTDMLAVIKFTGLMGQNFISLEGGTEDAPLVTKGATLQSREQADLSSIMQKLESVASGVEGLTKSFSAENFSTILGPMTDFVKQNSAPLSAMIGNFRTVSDNIVQGKGTVGKLLTDDSLFQAAYTTVTNLQTASTDIKGFLAEAQGMMTNANSVIDQINAGQGTLGKLTRDETLYTETTTAMTNLREILQKINQGQGSVGKLVNDDSLFKNAKLTLQKVEKATEGLEDQGPLSVLGIAVNSLF